MTSLEFDRKVLRSDSPVLVDFWAGWCAPCRTMDPTVDALAKAHGERLRVTKLNVDENPELVERFDVQSIPTFLFFQDGKMVERFTGVVSFEVLEARLNQLTNVDRNN